MNDIKEIDSFARLQKLISLFQRVNQLSWTSDQTRKRYPNPELMTQQEVDALTKLYLALGFDLKQMADEWQRNMTITKIPSEFYIHHDKFQDLSDKAVDFFIKSFKFEYESPEWKICRLKQSIYMKEALKHLKETQKY